MSLAVNDNALTPAAPAPRRVATVIGTEAQALATAERLAQEFAADSAERDRHRNLPWHELDRLSEEGLLGITVPRAYGGADVSPAVLARVIATLSRGDGSIGQIPQNHFYALEVLRVGGTKEQKKALYALALSGHRFGNALAEIGRRDFRRTTRLERDGDGYTVSGRKFYCTGAIYAHVIPTLAVAQEDGTEVSYLVFVPRSAPGISIDDDWDGFGQRVTGSGTVTFDRVAVDAAAIVPFQASFDRPTTIGPFAQLLHAAIDLGIGEAAYRETIRFVRERARPWIDANVETAAQDPLTIHHLGEVHVGLRAAQALLARAGRIVAAAQAAPDEDSVAAASIAVAEARIHSTKAGLAAANRLLELSGTSATMEADNLDRYWRNVRTHTLHDPVRWKYQAVGQYYFNQRRPPRHGAI
ncbi:SfnB family sulfur acquisition oxidoreductase [Aureimonas frigidaquae]|uniref:SfnB family sulfur acquisition oxidoreductase n=1 Tax=Aureimonas frigidaquae TaxID=424757 RepID=UPI0007816BBE|nr:SfnB family sulfur acquisition oxidoreductase [Aureimonas frigidaquae]